MKENQIVGASRVALAAMLHDLGKLAERARIDLSDEQIEANSHQYCPSQEAGGKQWFTHKHAAYTAVAMDLLESRGLLPPIKGEDLYPFKSWRGGEADDSLINAAARHHRPESALQWIIATADRVASGFEREKFDQYNRAEEKTSTGKNHYTARMLTLFEQIRLDDTGRKQDFEWRYPLQPLTVKSMMPLKAGQCEGSDNGQAQAEYRELWEQFLLGLERIPKAHRDNLALWLDHLDSCLNGFMQAIPSATAFGVRPEVSLYDHSKATTALATALWGYHEENKTPEEEIVNTLRNRSGWDEEKFLLIQGDLFGIQDFIFATAGETRKRAAKLLRGRSFQVALMSECAALKVLDLLNLPPTSQVMNAAGKFLIVAPNTGQTRQKLQQIKSELNQWFLQYTWGQAGVGIAEIGASCNDFLTTATRGEKSAFDQLLQRLFDALDQAKRQRFDLCRHDAPMLFGDYLDAFDAEHGLCAIDSVSPANHKLEDQVFIGTMARDQIDIGRYLVDAKRLLITREPLQHNSLRLDLFGYYINFSDTQEVSGKFGRVAAEGTLLRCWDFTLPEDEDEVLFHGYARRAINGYVPRFAKEDQLFSDKYQRLKSKEQELDIEGGLKTLNHIACEDLIPDGEMKSWLGVDALMTLKGDVDDLGRVFQEGVGKMTFAKMAALSRQVNGFFSTWLPWYCSQQFPNSYTVFAGGDDFFLIGPWRSQMNLAREMRRHFSAYVANNPELHFSAGLTMSRPGLPIRALADRAEEALERAKAMEGQRKNALTCHGQTVGWDQFEALSKATESLEALADDFNLSTGYVYGMIYLAEMAENVGANPENAMWHSRFAYRTRRLVERMRGLDRSTRDRYQQELTRVLYAEGLNRYAGSYKIALTSYLYKFRNTGAR